MLWIFLACHHVIRRPCWWCVCGQYNFPSKNLHENRVQFPKERNAFVLNQGAKKILFTAWHSGKLKLAFTSPDVISTSYKSFLTSSIDLTVLQLFEFLKKKITFPSGKLKTEFTSPSAKSTACFCAKARLMRVTSHQEDKQTWENCGWVAEEKENLKRSKVLEVSNLTYRLEKSLFETAKGKSARHHWEKQPNLTWNWPSRWVSSIKMRRWFQNLKQGNTLKPF